MSGRGGWSWWQASIATLAFGVGVAGCGRTPGPVPPGPTDAAVDAALDAGEDAAEDAGPDAGMSACEADSVMVALCPDVVCDGPPGWHWNGDSCFPIECGACTGSGCEGGAPDEATCRAAHAACEASRCRDTGGTYRWWAEDCGHWQCGRPMPEVCLLGAPSCDCGPSRSFDPVGGCFDDPTCPVTEPVPEEFLCVGSGGDWDSICCPTECGEGCADPCLSPACNCGPERVFDPVRGCIEAARCFERGAGQTCAGRARCRENAVCCEHCGPAGCTGSPTCEAPLCDDDESIDVCGNDLDGP